MLHWLSIIRTKTSLHRLRPLLARKQRRCSYLTTERFPWISHACSPWLPVLPMLQHKSQGETENGKTPLRQQGWRDPRRATEIKLKEKKRERRRRRWKDPCLFLKKKRIKCELIQSRKVSHNKQERASGGGPKDAFIASKNQSATSHG